MTDLCKYKGLFGEPNAGLRKYRIFDIAILDTLVVIFFGFLISLFINIPLWLILVWLFITGIIVHRLFCVRTGLDKKLFA
jgi:hypothetical protein